MDATLTDDSGASAQDEYPVRPRRARAGDEPRPDDHRSAVAVADPDVDTRRVAALEPPLATELLADLHDPRLVLSEGYIGTDRRATGLRSRIRRATFGQRRALLRVETLVVLVVTAVAGASLLLVGSNGPASGAARATSVDRAAPPTGAGSGRAPAPASVPAPATTAPAAPAASATAPSATAPSPSTTAPVAAAPPAAAPAATVPPAAPAALTPAQMGAEALTLVRYPWQRIPGYTIQFLPIADAPSPGFYGNTTFTWGHTGGTSVLYVYAGETVQRLAAITAFEIGHEVDAAAVEPQGGEAQIENVLGIHPASWAPDCDCAEQGFLSGWYAAAFSNYWSPGVGSFSTLAPEPTGDVLTAVDPWLNPTIPS